MAYTDEEILEKLKNQYAELGRIPRVKELAVSEPTLIRRFGSTDNALKLIGINPLDRIYTRESLSKILRTRYEELGRVPKNKDLKKPCYQTYERFFNSYEEALVAAGIDPSERFYTQERLIKEFKQLYEALGRLPKQSEFKARGSAERLFEGGFNELIRAAGYLPARKWTDEEFLDKLRDFLKDYDDIPSYNYLKDITPFDLSIARLRFGSWTNTLLKLGYELSGSKTKGAGVKKRELPPSEFLEEFILYSNGLEDFLSMTEITTFFGKRIDRNYVKRHFGGYRELKVKAYLSEKIFIPQNANSQYIAYSYEQTLEILKTYKQKYPDYLVHTIEKCKQNLKNDFNISLCTASKRVKREKFSDFKKFMEEL